MHERSGFYPAVGSMLGWKTPFPDAPTAKEIKRLQMERDHLEEYGFYAPPEFKESDASRSIRVFVGFKEVPKELSG